MQPKESSAGDPTRSSTISHIETNLAEYWLSLGSEPPGYIQDNGAIRCAYSGGPFFNRVVSARLASETIDREIENVVRSYRDRRAAITWLTGPSTYPDDLGNHLLRHGFSRYDDWRGMAHDLYGLTKPRGAADRLNVQPVRDERSRRDWCLVICRSFNLPRRACRTLFEHVSRKSDPESSVWHHNLAYQDGVPVAASTVFVNQGVAGIYLVATVPEARNQGFGTSMTELALFQARDLGCRMAVLHATEDGQRIYERLGFRHYCDIGVYRFSQPSPVWMRVAGACLRRLKSRWPRNGRGREHVTDRHQPGIRYQPGDQTAIGSRSIAGH